MTGRGLVAVVVAGGAFLAGAGVARGIPVIYNATSAASCTTSLAAFEAALGGANNGTMPPQASGFRTINWDGVPAAFAAPNFLPANFFNVTSPRGAVLSTAGTGFEVSGATSDNGAGQPAPANFGDVNPTYTTLFSQFSAQRLFTPLGSNVYDVTFYRAGTVNFGYTHGFAAVFTNVENANTTSIQYFDQSNTSLGTFYVPTSASGQNVSCLGVVFSQGSVVSRVRVTNGNAPLGGNNSPPGTDLVVNDDFAYGEPLAAPTAVTVQSFTAHRRRGAVVLRWHAAAGAELAGFDLYREGSAGKRVRLNRSLIYARPALGSRSYSWSTPARSPGRYWLRTLTFGGAVTWTGPALG
jgi:hypothetical protein